MITEISVEIYSLLLHPRNLILSSPLSRIKFKATFVVRTWHATRANIS